MKELELISIKSDIMFHDLINKDNKNDSNENT